MNRIKLYFVLLGLLLLGSFQNISGQNVLVAGALVGNGLYPDLGSAFTGINGGAQTGSSIIISIVGNTTEGATATLNPGTWSSLTILPTGGSARTITGSIAGPLVDLNGADRILIDGLNTGGNSLTFNNTAVAATSTIRFINDSRSVAVQNCTLLGANTSTTSGTVFIASSAGGGGNDSIAFVSCLIDASGANFPTNGVLSIGTAGQDNGTITFSNCNIPNYFNAGTATAGILVGANNTDWTISGCRFYQAATRTYTVANTHKGIQIGSGNNHVISNNIIGFATVGGTGAYTMQGLVASRFIAIDLAVGTTIATSVQGNTVTNIGLTTTSGANTLNGILCGVNITSGNVNVGNITPNIFGGAAGVDLMVGAPTTTQGAVVGIHSSSTGVIAIQNNIFGGLTSGNPVTATVAGAVFGINISGAASTLTITGNTIGNATASSIRGGVSGFTTGSSLVAGINITTNPTTLAIVTGNTIRNLASFGSGTGGYVRGIATPLTTSTTATYTVSNNTILNLTTNATLTGITSGQCVAAGIQFFAAGGSSVSQNSISNISATNTGTGNYVVAGITLAASTTAANNTISQNQIYNLSNAGTGTTVTSPPVVTGIGIRSGASNQYNIQNNMISLGNGQTTNTCFIGIWGNHGSTPNPTSVNILFNTINIEGTVGAGALPSFCFNRGDLSATTRTIPVDIRNNIFTNSRTGGTGVHYAISNNLNATSNNTGWPANASNNNVLNAAAANVGYWTTSQTFAGWQTAAASDAASYSGITVTYVNSANDLHLNMGVTPTVIESNAQTIPSISIDIDAQTRPGPAGSVNGGGYLPDIGADEIDAVPLDMAPPIITYTPLTFTCGTSDRVLTATIQDLPSGVPTAGALQPRIYFRKNAGAYFSTQGVLTSGTGTNGTWSFTIVAATMGGLTTGDVVSYFVIAQDMAAPTNIGSNPSTGLVASDVNTVTTPPTSPNSYPISATLIGTYTVGAAGTYPTLTAAVAAYNTSCLGGPIMFSLIDATYPSETFPISINANPDASSTNTLTIKPLNPGTSISGSSASSIIKLNGADYVTIDGSSGAVVNNACSPVASASKDLTISNTSTASATGVVWISSTGTGAGSTFNTVKNCILQNGVDQSTTATDNYGIVSCGATITIFPPPDGLDNNNNLIENNTIIKTNWGIYLRGGAASSNTGNTIRQNIIGPAVFGSDQLRKGGIILQNQNTPQVTYNEVRFVGNQIAQAVGGTDHIGIGIGGADGPTPTTTNVTNATVTNNKVHDIVCEKTFSAIGILLAVPNGTATNNMIANNFIYNVRTNATSPDQGIGIDVSNGNNDKILFNNISMITADRDPAGATTASESDMGIRVQAGSLNQSIANNIINVDESSNTASLKNFAMVVSSAAYSWGTGMNNYNDYYVPPTNTQMVLFGLGTTGAAIPQVTTLAAWQGTFTPNQDANSLNVQPQFISSTNLHLATCTNPALDNAGTSAFGITTDFDCEARSATPDIGADEVLKPEVNVRGNGITIVSADVTPSTTDSTDYENICLNSPATSRTYTIENIGADTLNVSSIILTGPDAAMFSVVGAPTNVAPSSNATFTVSFTPSSVGMKMATVNINSDDCDEALYNFDIMATVDTLPIVSYLASPNDTICSGSNITLSGTGADTYAWSGGVVDGATFVPGGSATYTVTGTDLNGCTNTASASIVVNPLPTISYTASPNDTICTGDSITLSGTGGISYVWTGSISDGVAFVPAGSGSYTVTGTDGFGCQNTATAQVVVNTLPSVSFTVSPNDTVCSGSTVTLSGTGATSYSWSGGISDGVAFIASGTQTYTVTGTTAGCSSQDSATITVNNGPVVGYSVTPNDTVCPGDAITLSGSGAVSYVWSGGVTNGAAFIPAASQTYTVTGTGSNGCTSTASAPIVVGTTPSVDLGPDVIQPNPPATLDAGAGFTSYLWSTTEVTQIINVNTNGQYIVTVTNIFGCSDSDTIQVNFTSGVMNPDGSSTTISLYPNPTSNGVFNVNISNLETSNLTMEILDMNGSVVYNRYVGSVNGSIIEPFSLTDLRMGTYVIRVHANGKSVQLRFIVNE
jgi:trimeric autotransporter adhesin